MTGLSGKGENTGVMGKAHNGAKKGMREETMQEQADRLGIKLDVSGTTLLDTPLKIARDNVNKMQLWEDQIEKLEILMDEAVVNPDVFKSFALASGRFRVGMEIPPDLDISGVVLDRIVELQGFIRLGTEALEMSNSVFPSAAGI